jgi:ElaB/YqjD/DUF883 family membrane-anchored ribosome-binding protein
MTKSTIGAGEDINADLTALRQDVARLSESVSALLQSQAQGAARHVSDAVDDAKARFAGTAADVKERVNAAGGEIEASIAHNPLTAMLIAFGAGMALGMMTRSRH